MEVFSMAYTIKITYAGVETDASRIVSPICRIFAPTNSYIDTPVYTEGGPVGADPLLYGKSVYATNVDGFGSIEMPEPYASTSIPFPVPLAQFKLAVVGEVDEESGNHFVEFDVDDYKEAFHYKELGAALADQGFTVEVTKN